MLEAGMMEENRTLRNKLTSKHNAIPRAVSYWLYFKAHILEKPDTRRLFQQPLSKTEFRTLVKKHASPLKCGPSFCRNRKGNAKRNTNDLLAGIWPYYLALLHPDSPFCVNESALGGLGLFCSEPLRVREGT